MLSPTHPPTTTLSRLPHELCDVIVDYVQNDLHLLRQLSLVSKAWLVRCAIWLYRTIQVVDDIVADARYIYEGAPYPTMRIRAFVPFLLRETAKGQESILRHLRHLRVACFWNDDDETWSEYLSAWMGLQFPTFISVERLQVFLCSKQNVGSLLQVLALHFRDVYALDVAGFFADGAQMAMCFSAFPRVVDLRFHWPQLSDESGMRLLLPASSEAWMRMPFSSCRLRVNFGAIYVLLKWFEGNYRTIESIDLEDSLPTSDGRLFVDTLNDLSYDQRTLIRSAHLCASSLFTSPTYSRNVRIMLESCPRIALLRLAASYYLMQYSELNDLQHMQEGFDPISAIAGILRRDATELDKPLYTCPSLSTLLIELKIPAEYLTVLWFHNWSKLDHVVLLRSRKADGLKKVIISLCVTGTSFDSIDKNRQSAKNFIRNSMPLSTTFGVLESNYSELPARTSLPRWQNKAQQTWRSEDEFLQFARSDFPNPIEMIL